MYLFLCPLHTNLYVSGLSQYHKQPRKNLVVCWCLHSFVISQLIAYYLQNKSLNKTSVEIILSLHLQ